jgi:mutator protein MutT
MKKHVAIVIKNEKNEILFIKRAMSKKTLPGAWSFPSGTVEIGEDINKTTIREAKEELNVLVIPIKIIAEKELPEFSVCLIFILCTIQSGKPIIKEPKEIDKFEWIKFSDFFDRFSDNEIGHGLVWLRKNPELWEHYN